ncbi:MAG: hypothetical protein ACU84Q_10800 [Gammaproteobacteria bacterium]
MLEALGNIGDFIGGIAVVVTLLYLANQVRQNTKSTQSASYQAIVSSMSVFSREMAFEENRSALFVNGLLHPNELSESEQTRFALLMTSYFRSLENIHFQYQSKAIPDDVWEGWAYRIATSVQTPGCRKWWQVEQRAYSGRFRKYINEEAMFTEIDQVLLGIDVIADKTTEMDS